MYRSRNPGKHDSNLDVFNWCAQQGIESLRCLLADYYEDIDIAEMTDHEVQELCEEKKGYLFEKVEEREGGEQSRDKKRRLPIDVQRPARPANLPFPPKLASVTDPFKKTIARLCGSGYSKSARRDFEGRWHACLPQFNGQTLRIYIADAHPALQRDKKILFLLRGPVPHLVLRTVDGVDITPLLSSSAYYQVRRFILFVWRSMDYLPQLAEQQWDWHAFLQSFADVPGVSGFLADERDQAWTVAGCRGTPKEYLLGNFALRPSSGEHFLVAGNHQVFVPPERLQPHPQLLALLESATVPVALQLDYPHLVFAYGEEEPIGPLEGILVDGVDGGYQQMAAVLQEKRTERTKEP